MIEKLQTLFGLKVFKRNLVQLLAALLYNLNFKGFKTGTIYQGNTKAICVPGLNCYSCPGAIAACPIGSLQASLVAGGGSIPFYILGTLLAFGALFGRTVCGWLCPIGLLQDLLDKTPLPKLKKGRWSRILSKGKYLILFSLVIIAPLVLLKTSGIGTPAFCAWLCPAGTLQAGIPLLSLNEGLRFMIGSLFIWKIFVLLALSLISLFVYRPFCRFLCPLGALYSFFNRFALLRYKVDDTACNNCGVCLSVCKTDIREVSDAECIQCGACSSFCQQDAIHFSLRDMIPRTTSTKQ